MQTSMESLQIYLKQFPGIQFLQPNDAGYGKLQSYYVKRTAKACGVVRPQDATHVQALVRFCVSNNVDFVVRSGGHDCIGRTQIDGALTIDMRDIRYVKVSDDKKTAQLGGGILFRDVIKALSEEGVATPVGLVASVGYVGWATLGGYGLFATEHGPGVDQIVGAKLVNAAGDVIEADEEMLKGIRGGGGSLGIIVELTVKVFPQNEILAGFLVLDSTDMEAVWQTFTEGYYKLADSGSLPKSLHVQPCGLEIPGLGKSLTIFVAWTGQDLDEGREWIRKISRLGTCALDMTKTTTLLEFCEENESVAPSDAFGRVKTTSVFRLTPETTKIVAKHVGLLPGGGAMVAIHMLRRPAPSNDSVFASRIDHCMIEMVATSPDEAAAEKADKWAQSFIEDLKDHDPGNILPSSYIAFVDSDEATLAQVYGQHYETLLALKKEHDPDNIFKNSVPRF